jgi:hypothetical protein
VRPRAKNSKRIEDEISLMVSGLNLLRGSSSSDFRTKTGTRRPYREVAMTNNNPDAKIKAIWMGKVKCIKRGAAIAKEAKMGAVTIPAKPALKAFSFCNLAILLQEYVFLSLSRL